MRKIIISLLLTVACLNLQAQTYVDVVSAATATATSKSAQPSVNSAFFNNWSYSKLAVGVAEGSSLKGFAGDFAVSQVEGMLNSVAPTVGITANIFSVVFKKNGSLVFAMSGKDGVAVKGSYSIKSKDSIVLNIGNVGKIHVGSLTAKVKIQDDNITLLFAAKDLFAIADKIPSLSNDTQYQMVRGVATNLDGLLLGFNLKKN